LKDAHGALAVPKPGIRSDGKSSYVLIVDAGKVSRRDVVTGVTDEMRSLVEIKQGLSGGETAIIGPAEGLKIGDLVQVVGREG
jgi:hypothetical protein